MLIPRFLILYLIQSQQFLDFRLDQEEYFQVLSLYIQFYYDANNLKLNKFIKNIVKTNFHLIFLSILNV